MTTPTKFRSVTFALLLGSAFAFAGCNGDAENAGEKIDDAIEDAGDEIEDATDKIGDKVEKSTDKK